MKDRVYICHTFYHVYIALLKELVLPISDRGNATLILSTMSNKFGLVGDRAKQSGLFEDVFIFDEKEDVTSEEVMKYHRDRGNVVLNLLQRIKYTKALGKLQEKYIPTDLKAYKQVYVFCDSDPIGYYLNYKRIKYHALEDGLDTIKYCDDARYSNRGHFKLKALMASMNLIVIENGYSKYCVDMEVNDISCLKYKIPKFRELSRKELAQSVSKEDTHFLTDILMEDSTYFKSQISNIPENKKKVMILSDPVCDLETRARITRDIITEYGKDSVVIIKPHPRDILDYTDGRFDDCIVLKGNFPMEMMNYIDDFKVDTIISIFTVIDNIEFATNKVFLGVDFMDKYEAPEIHRQNEMI